MSLIFKAMEFAEKAHRGQTRKYSDTPYFIHPLRVMYRIRDIGYTGENILAAALLHDTVEDCDDVSFEDIEKQFNTSIYLLVREVTQADKIHDEIKNLPRTERHKANVEKLKIISLPGKILKCADRLDNLSDTNLSNNECYGFLKRRYLQESWDIYNVVGDSDMQLGGKLKAVICDLADKCKVELK